MPFTQGTLAVARYGDRTGAAPTSGVTLPAALDEYTTTGTLVRSISIPVADAGSNFGLTGSAVRSNNDGVMGISPDRTKLSLAAYNLPPGTANAASASTASRVVAIFDAQGNINTSAGFSSTTNPLRTSLVTNAGGIYVAFGAETAGITYAPAPTAVTPPASVVPTAVLPLVSAKKMQVYDGNLYFTTSSTGATTSGAKIRRFTGLPTAAATAVDLPGIPATGTPAAGAFVMFDVNPAVPGVDLLYYTDDVTAGSPVNKYTFNGTTWTARGTYTLTGVTDGLIRDMTGQLENGVPTLYAVTYTSLVKLADASAYTANISVTKTALVDNLSGGSYAFRGISFSPGTRETIALNTASAQLAQEITLSPNPAQAEVYLSLPATLQRETLAVSVINALGQTVRTQKSTPGAGRMLPLTGLTAGVYTLRLETSAGVVNKRLICE
ncbi:hypothetical protein GCM10028822_43090 [Hymenobacter terrigena]